MGSEYKGNWKMEGPLWQWGSGGKGQPRMRAI